MTMPLVSPRTATMLLLLGILSALFTLGCHVAWRNEPFDVSKAGAVGADQFGYCMRAFDACGWWNLHLAPSYLFVQGDENWSLPYVHHPFLPYSLTYASWALLGRTEAALRWPALAAFIVTCLAVAVLGHRCAGRAGAGLALAFFAVQPVVIQYGNMVDLFPLSMASMLIAAIAWLRASGRASPSGCTDAAHRAPPRLGAYAICAFLCGLLGWYGYMLVPALWLDILFFAPRPLRKWRTVLAIGLPFGIAALLHIVWMVWVLGGVEHALDETNWLLSTFSGGSDHDLYAKTFEASSLVTLGRFFVDGSGWSVLALATLGLLLGLARQSRAAIQQFVRIPLLITVAGLLPSFAFWTRASTHEFFVLFAAPGLALLAAGGVLYAANTVAQGSVAWPRMMRVGMLAAIFVAMLAGLATLASAGVRLHDGLRQDSQQDLDKCLSSVCEDGDVILLATMYRPGQRLYVRHTVIPGAASERVFRWALRELRTGQHAVRRILLVTDGTCLQYLGWLESDLTLLKRDTFRRLSCGAKDLIMVELDRAACLR